MMKQFKNQGGIYDQTTPFLYIVGWPDLHKFYIGIRYTSGCNPDDMWVRYFTSSKYVHAIAAEHGKPPYIDIIKTFQTADEAKKAEFDILRDNGALQKEWFINLRAGNAIRMTDEVRAKVGARSAERWKDPAYRANQKAKRTPPPKTAEQLEAEEKAKLAAREDGKRRRSEALVRDHKDPALKAKRLSGWRTPEAAEKRAQTRAENPTIMTDAGKAAVSAKAYERWADPAFKAKMADNLVRLQEARKAAGPEADPRAITRAKADAIFADTDGTYPEIAKRHGVGRHMVLRIKNGQHWSRRQP